MLILKPTYDQKPETFLGPTVIFVRFPVYPMTMIMINLIRTKWTRLYFL